MTGLGGISPIGGLSSIGSGLEGGITAPVTSSPGGLPSADQTGGSDGGSFSDMLKSMVIDGPSGAQNKVDSLSASFAAGGDVDPQTLAIESAKAGVEIQMATRTISSVVTAVRTLMQTQV